MRFSNSLIAALGAGIVLPSAVLAQPAISRGEQYMAIGFPECMTRARTAFERLGWVSINPQANVVSAFRGQESAYIVCNETTGGRYVINIFVASGSGDGGIAGSQRQALQAGMEGNFAAAPPINTPPPMGGPVPPGQRWILECCGGQYRGDITLQPTGRQGPVILFGGSFSAAVNGGTIINGTWNEATGAIYFRRDMGGGLVQDYTGQVVNQNGRLRVINGRWTGAYSDRAPDNWSMELQ